MLLDGKVVKKGFSLLRPEYIILFKAKAYLDLKSKKSGGIIVYRDIKKYKNDIFFLSLIAFCRMSTLTNIDSFRVFLLLATKI